MSGVKVRTVSLDFWGTLMLDSPASDDRCRGARLTGMRQVLASLGMDVTLAQLTLAYQASGEHLARIWTERRDVGVVEHVSAMLRAIDPKLAEQVSGETMTALVDAYARPLLLVLPAVDPGARATCTRLRDAGLTMVLVSNTMRTPGTVLRQVLASLGLLECFDHTVFSDEAGIRKPDPAIFLAALGVVGGEPATTVHVGDDPVLDVQGAQAAGLRTIQVVAGGPRGRAAATPDRTINRLEELPAAIAAIENE